MWKAQPEITKEWTADEGLEITFGARSAWGETSSFCNREVTCCS